MRNLTIKLTVEDEGKIVSAAHSIAAIERYLFADDVDLELTVNRGKFPSDVTQADIDALGARAKAITDLVHQGDAKIPPGPV